MQNSGQFLAAIVIGLCVGSLLAAQPSINGSLGRVLEKPISAAFLSFAIGTATLIVVAGLWGGLFPKFTTPAKNLPWWIWFGGVIGVIVVFTSLFFVPKIGSLPWFAALMTGQVITAMLLDHFALLGNQKSSMSPLKMAGAGCLVFGVLLIAQAKRVERAVDEPPTSTTQD